MIDWKLRVWCFLVDYCFKRTIFICIKKLLVEQLDWTFGAYIDLFTVFLTFFELLLATFALFIFEGLVSCFECLSTTERVFSLELFRERSDFFWIVRFKRKTYSLGFFVLRKFIIAFSENFETKRFNFLLYIGLGASLHLK